MIQLADSPRDAPRNAARSDSVLDSGPAQVTVVELSAVDVYYGAFHAVSNVSFDVPLNQITALIGPSGCGKSTVLRCINRMNDLVQTARVEGEVRYHGVNINNPAIDPVEVRRRIGMVFQKANPFPKSIYD